MNYHSNPKEPLQTNRPDNSVTGLAAGTLVTTPEGGKKIEDVKAGDLVLSGVGSGYSRFCEVEKAISNPYNGPMLRFTTTSKHQLLATPNHICFGFSPSKEPLIHDKNTIHLFAFTYNLSGAQPLKCAIFTEENLQKETITEADGEYRNLDEAEGAARKMATAGGGAEVRRYAEFVESDIFHFHPTKDLKVKMSVPVVNVKATRKCKSIRKTLITNTTEEAYDGFVYALDVPEARNFAANGVLVHDSTSVQL